MSDEKFSGLRKLIQKITGKDTKKMKYFDVDRLGAIFVKPIYGISGTLVQLSMRFPYPLHFCSREDTGGIIAQADLENKVIRIVYDLRYKDIKDSAFAAQFKYIFDDPNKSRFDQDEVDEIVTFYESADSVALTKHLFLHEVAHIELQLPSMKGRAGDEVEHKCDLWAVRKLLEIS